MKYGVKGTDIGNHQGHRWEKIYFNVDRLCFNHVFFLGKK